jgi:phage tail P2-like protein
MEKALEQVAAGLLDFPVPIRDVRSPDSCPPRFLPWVAWDLSVDKWDTNWSESQQRGVARSSISVHRRKGTVGALKDALSALGHDLEVREWHELRPVGVPCTFGVRVTVDQEGIPNKDALDTVVAVANSTKNTRSHMTGVEVLAKTQAELHFGGAVLSGEIVSIAAYFEPDVPNALSLDGTPETMLSLDGSFDNILVLEAA